MSVLEGVSAKTTKDELLKRLEEADETIGKLRRGETSRLRAIEKRVREKHKPGDYPALKNVIVSGTPDEIEEATAFLSDFSDKDGTILPPLLQRLLKGCQVMIGGYDKKASDADDDD